MSDDLAAAGMPPSAAPRSGTGSDAVPPAAGLGGARAAELLQSIGPNTVPEERPTTWRRLAARLWAPIPWMIEATAGLELALRKWAEAAIVAAIVVFNAVLGFIQEGRAQAVLDLLRQRLALRARVLRDGAWQLLPAVDLVLGDGVHVRMGDFVPADLLIADGQILVDQSVLTGESVPRRSRPGRDRLQRLDSRARRGHR